VQFSIKGRSIALLSDVNLLLRASKCKPLLEHFVVICVSLHAACCFSYWGQTLQCLQ